MYKTYWENLHVIIFWAWKFIKELQMHMSHKSQIPETEGLELEKFLFSQFEGWRVQDQGAG